jgi:hypothetical protein
MKRNRDETGETEEWRVEQLLARLEGAIAPPEDALRAMARAAARSPRAPAPAVAGRISRPRHLRWGFAVAVALLIGSGFGFALGSSQTPDGSAAEGPVELGFVPAEGWNVLQTATKAKPARPAQQAIAANVPLRPEDDADGVPYSTLLSLPRHGVVIVANFILAREHAGAASFPTRGLPLRLRDATPSTERGGAQVRPARPLGQFELRAKVNGYRVEVNVYFGTDRPTPELITAAQRQLDRLAVRSAREGNPLERALPMRAGSLSVGAGTRAAARIVDRTFRCTPVRAVGGHGSFDIDAVPVGETDSFTRNPRQGESPGFIGVRTGPWVLGSELVAVRARSWLRFPPSPSPPGVYARVGRCATVRVSVPLSPRGLPGPPVQWAEKASCTSRGRVLVRVRAVLQSAASWRRANRSYDGARRNVVEAALAIRIENGRRPIAFAELGPAGKTRLWTSSSDCT